MSASQVEHAQPVVTIEPARGLLGIDLRELWAYRYLFYRMALRPIQARYRQTVLGISWAVIKPAVGALVFTVFFGKLLRVEEHVRVPYPLFIYAGLLPWNFMASTVSGAAGNTVGNAGLINKVYFPRILLPLSVLGATLLDFAIAATVLVGIMVWYGAVPGLGVLLLPVVLLGVVGCAIGIGSLLSALNVWYRDFRYVLPMLIQTWMFLTPVIYPEGIVPERFRWLANLNPMTGLVTAFRSCLGLEAEPLNWWNLGIAGASALVIFVVGLWGFRQFEDRFADVV